MPNLCPVTVTNNTQRGWGQSMAGGRWHAEEEREKHTKGRRKHIQRRLRGAQSSHRRPQDVS